MLLFVTALSHLVDEHFQKFSVASVMNLSANLSRLPKFIIMYITAQVMCSFFFVASQTYFFGQKCDSPRTFNDMCVNDEDFLFFARLLVHLALIMKNNVYRVSKCARAIHFTKLHSILRHISVNL